jgi:hypothetical protein
MREVMRIDPLRNEPGLVAYECPACVYVTSVLLPGDGRTKDDVP